jgi:hypothetical protein
MDDSGASKDDQHAKRIRTVNCMQEVSDGNKDPRELDWRSFMLHYDKELACILFMS